MDSKDKMTGATANDVENGVQMDRLKSDGVCYEGSNETGGNDVRGGCIDLDTRADEEAQSYPNGLKFWFIIFTLSALLILGGLDTNIVATAVPRLV